MTSSAIDISALPSLELVEQLTLDEATQQALFWLSGEGLELDGGAENPAYRVLRSLAYREAQFRAALKTIVDNFTLATATGSALDHIGITYHRTARHDGEADEAYRSRIALAPEGLSVAGPINAYIARAKAAHASVVNVVFASPQPNEVVLTVLIFRLEPNPNEVLMAVEQAVNADDARPQGDQVTVIQANTVTYDIDASITLASGTDEQLYKALALRKLNATLLPLHRIGGRVVASQIISALHDFGAIEVELNGFTDIQADSASAPLFNTATLRVL